MTHEHCEELFEALKEYLDGTAKEEFCRAIEQHMRDCPDCRVHVNTLKGTIELYKSVGCRKMPSEARERLHKALKIDPRWLKHPEKG
jgi:predicted anti-sigma-YlaC factor YlaD